MLISDARKRANMIPVFLVTITLKASGPVLRLSDRNITVVSNYYENYLNGTSGIAALLSIRSSRSQNVPIIIDVMNKAYKAYSYLIEIRDTNPFAGAAISVDLAYIDNSGVATTDIENLFTGTIDRLYDITKASFRMSVYSHEWNTKLKKRA